MTEREWVNNTIASVLNSKRKYEFISVCRGISILIYVPDEVSTVIGRDASFRPSSLHDIRHKDTGGH